MNIAGSATQLQYHKELAAAPKRDVRPREFEEACLLAGWDAHSVTLLLRLPYFTGYVLVGRESLRITP